MCSIDSINKFLAQFITPERDTRINQVLNNRTRYITIVLEDLYQSHNISAVLRSCDCFGINDIHLIENRNEYVYHKDIEMGSSNWLDIYRYNKKQNNTIETINTLKKNGYRIVATSPHKTDYTLESFDISAGPFALLFGTELTGLSDLALNNSDEFLKIPLFGFTESLNISVSAAIIMHTLYSRLTKSELNWKIPEGEKSEIKFNWLKNSIKGSDLLIKKFRESN